MLPLPAAPADSDAIAFHKDISASAIGCCQYADY
jgi:hypothetical protein